MLVDIDDLKRLRSNQHLLNLLSHYANLGRENRLIWQPRLNEMAGTDPSQMSKFHGELLAFEWVELNACQVPTSYRITPSGVRAVSQVQGVEAPMETPEPQEKPAPKFPRKKREKTPSTEVAGVG